MNSNQFILKGTLQIYRIKYDLTYHKTDLVQKILCDSYMDNTTNIFKELDTAVMFYVLIRKRIQVKEMRNDSTIRDFLHQNETSYQLNLVKNCEKKGIPKVLRDEFVFDFQNFVNQANEFICTNRNVSKVDASVFDPPGLLIRVTLLQTKLLFKNIAKPNQTGMMILQNY